MTMRALLVSVAVASFACAAGGASDVTDVARLDHQDARTSEADGGIIGDQDADRDSHAREHDAGRADASTASTDSQNAPPRVCANVVNDRAVTLAAAAHVDERRKALIRYIWGTDTLPLVLPSVRSFDSSPVTGLPNLSRAYELRTSVNAGAGSVTTLAFLFVPMAANDHAVLLHDGHGDACGPGFNDGPPARSHGMKATISRLLGLGYSVAAIYMPLASPGESCSHAALFKGVRDDEGARLRYFMEPVAAVMNHLNMVGAYTTFSMIGLSGGGWSTVLYTALDARIEVSFDVSGSQPLYMRSGPSLGDEEQTFCDLYRRAGYLDLYALGAHGPGRRRVQVFNRTDPCCFSEATHDLKLTGESFEASIRRYAADVQRVITDIGGQGSFEVVFEREPGHSISQNVLETVILPGLAGS